MRWIAPLLLLVAVLMPPPARAEPVQVTFGKASVLRLPFDAGQIVIGNPAIIDITLENPRLLFLFGKAVGETNILIFDGRQREMMVEAVQVSPERDRHIKVFSPARRGSGADEVTYNCNGRCVRVVSPRGTEASGAVPIGPDEGAGAPPAAEN